MSKFKQINEKEYASVVLGTHFPYEQLLDCHCDRIPQAAAALKRLSDDAGKKNTWVFKLEQIISDLEGGYETTK